MSISMGKVLPSAAASVAPADKRLVSHPLLYGQTRPATHKVISGVTKSGFLHRSPSHKKCVFNAGPTVQKAAKFEMGSVSQTDLVLPASELYAEEAIQAVKAGKVIAVPTDTLYGFACDACSAEAVSNIYKIKGRKHSSPMAICVADVADISRFSVVDHLPDGLLANLLPGPVTVVLRRGDSSVLDRSLNSGLDSIGVRVPDSNFIRAISRGAGSALALTSANLSGHPSSISIKDFAHLWQYCKYIYDAGLLPSGRAGSTVVDVITPGLYKIVRPGSAEKETVAILERFNLREDA